MDFKDKWAAERGRAAFLALDDGTVFHGVAFGARKDGPGEVVFNTGMTGYQEILTDPSYAGQFVALTTAEVGNYGINSTDPESRGLFLSGLVIGDLTPPSNWRSEKSLDDYLRENGVPGIYGVDTRRLAIHIREHGNRKAWLHVEDEPLEHAEAIRRAQDWEGLDGQDYAAKVSCKTAYDFPHAESAKNAETSSFAAERNPSFAPQAHPSFAPEAHPSFPAERHPSFAPQAHPSFTSGPRPLVAVYDFGVKANILRSLAAWARVRVFPAKTPAEEILALAPDGVFLSNGPADPAALPYAIENIRKILGLVPCDISLVTRHSSLVTPMTGGPRPPVMGICLGHQLLALACGAKTARLKFGHHGCNHPVKDLATGKVQITSQNHNFAVQADSMPDCLEVTHINLNDGTIEGLRHKTLPAFSVQYHPEACPGPHDASPLFDRFRALLRDARGGGTPARIPS